MIIGIDGSEAIEKVKVGSSEYTFQLLKSLYRICLDGKTPHKFIIFTKKENICDLPDESDFWKYEKIPSSNLWMLRKIIPRLLFGKKINLFFSPTHYLPIFTTVPQVCTIHDLGYLMFSEQFKRYDFWQLKYWTAISIIISKYIIAVSDSTKKDIVRHYPFAYHKVDTVYHGIDHRIFNSNISDNLVRHVKNKYKIRKNYILFVGTLKPSKNIEGIIKSFAKLLENNNDILGNYQMVIVGKRGWLYDRIFSIVKDLKMEENVIFTDYISLEDKRSLYKGARGLVSPSFWEGFGIQVLESMACGTPVIISSCGSLPEVAGKAGIYVDPYNIISITESLEKLVRMNKSEYNKVSDACVKRASMFTWEKTAQKTLNVFEKAIK